MTARKRLHPDHDDLEGELTSVYDNEASPVKNKVASLSNNKLCLVTFLALSSN